jgi:hypothetical protein
MSWDLHLLEMAEYCLLVHQPGQDLYDWISLGQEHG